MVKPAEKYDYVGHVTYPYNEKIQQTFFNERHKRTYKVTYDGSIISKGVPASTKLKKLWLSMGYHLTPRWRKEEHGKSSLNGINIRVHKIGRRGNPSEILVLVKARDIKELAENTSKLVEIVKRDTGIEGKLDLFGKMEMC